MNQHKLPERSLAAKPHSSQPACPAEPSERQLRIGRAAHERVPDRRAVERGAKVYRAYRAGVVKRAFDTYGGEFVAETGFSCMVDILLKLRRLDAIISEVPLVLRYDMKYGVSKMLVVRTVIDTLQLLVSRRLGRLR